MSKVNPKKKEEKKEIIQKPLSIEIKEAIEEITNAINRHHLTAVSIRDIGVQIANEGERMMQLEERQYYQMLQQSMKKETEEKENAKSQEKSK